MIRANPLQHYLSLMQSNGLAVGEVLAGTSVSTDTLSDSGNVISPDEYQTIVENMLRLTGDRGLGLDVGLHTDLMHLGTLGYAALSCGTLREAIELGKQYGEMFGFWGDMSPPRDGRDPDVVEIPAPWLGHAAYRFAVEAHLSFFLHAGAASIGVEPEVERLMFSYPEPQYVERYRQIFRCPMQFNARHTQLVAKGGWLDAPLKTRNEELNRICREHLDRLVVQIRGSGSVATKVRALLMAQQAGDFALEMVAAKIGVGSRTLERLLQKEGFSYRTLADDVRLQLAKKWLGTPMPSKQICHRLGFSDVNSFRRAFKRWTGQTIQDFRLNAVNPQQPS